MPDDPMSLFGKSSAPKKKRPKDAASEGLKAKKQQTFIESSQGTEEKVLEGESAQTLDAIRLRQAELDKQITAIERQGHHLPLELQGLLKDISNWPERKQDEIISRANAMVEKLNEAIGPGSIEPLSRKHEKKDEKRSQKAQKIRGKRNWISMQ